MTAICYSQLSGFGSPPGWGLEGPGGVGGCWEVLTRGWLIYWSSSTSSSSQWWFSFLFLSSLPLFGPHVRPSPPSPLISTSALTPPSLSISSCLFKGTCARRGPSYLSGKIQRLTQIYNSQRHSSVMSCQTCQCLRTIRWGLS